jgi:hypothetical protein
MSEAAPTIPDRLAVWHLHWRWQCYNAAAGYPQPETKGFWDYPEGTK